VSLDRTTHLRWTVLVIVLSIAMLPLVGTAAAGATPTPTPQPKGRISNLSVTDGVLNFTFGVSGVADAAVDQDTVRVVVGDTAVDATVSARQAAGSDRTAVLAIDTSDSMDEQLRRSGPTTRLDAAQDAARAFLDSVPDDVRVGLVTFAAEPEVRVPPTTNRDEVRNALDDLETGPDTALYRGVQTAVDAAGATGSRSILLLSDGRDEDTRGGSLAAVVETLTTSGVIVDVVALGDEQDRDALAKIADAGKGQVVEADRAEQLTTHFRSAAEAISSELDISLVVPERFSGRTVTIEVHARAGGQDVSDQVAYSFDVITPTDTDNGPKAISAPPAIGAWAGVAGLLGIGVGLAILLTMAALALTRQYTTRARIARLLGGRGAAEEHDTEHKRAGIAEPAVALTDRLLRRRNWDRAVAVRLNNAGLPLRPPEWVLLHAGTALFVGLVLAVLTGLNPIAAVIGVVVGVAGPWVYLQNRARARHQAFASALPETLQMVAGSLSAGLTLQQAIDAVANEGRAPVSDEIRRALVDVRLGMPLEDALSRIADRMSSPDFSWVVMAMRIQREVGGNLPELLTVVAATLRDRDRLRRQAQVLSAEGRISAWIVGALPVVFTCYMLIVRPSYLRPLMTDPLGWMMLFGSTVLFAVGVFWLIRTARLKV
jgi:tight adherence protein B